MYYTQYEIALPADFEMAAIRARVAAAAHLLDDRQGLGLKGYAIRERAGGSPVNEYAPFYLWNDAGPMAEFLAGGAGFERIVRSFGRVPVRHGVGIANFAGPARGGPAPAARGSRSRATSSARSRRSRRSRGATASTPRRSRSTRARGS